ncbi:hypothetical protein MKY37_13060 [Psychrobacillus sp. FSL K6-2836]|uniref:hypothetical protein n=1 Tax=Psychrobacillus sp. FSL K6-2836 TaxID=2921548 RepID=UPI0030FC7D3A
MAKKEVRDTDEYLTHLYVHVNEVEHFALFSGITVQQFIRNFSDLSALLLLKHSYDDASFNMHTQLEFIVPEQYNHFIKEFAEGPFEVCFMDFEDERKLNMLSPQEQAELLYIAHKKETFRSPFYHHLQNRFVYLSDEGEKITKIYFRDLEDFNHLVANIFTQLIGEKSKSTAFWRKKNNIVLPKLSADKVTEHNELFEDGVLMSLFKTDKSNYGIEIRILPENIFPDEVLGDLKLHMSKPLDVLIEV